MQILHDEAQYPLSFREADAVQLGQSLAGRHSVTLIGMKRVGISNFLRFFLYRDDIVPTYLHRTDRHLFIPVDCNDLIEIGLLPFWSLTLKRLVDIVNRNEDLELFREQINDAFVRSIQLRDVFYTMDAVRDGLRIITSKGYLPTIFFLRFDRMQPAVTPELLQNLKGMIDATGQALSYVFTTYRELHDLMPEVFPMNGTSAFSHPRYLKPADQQATQIIMDTFLKRYSMSLSDSQKQEILQAAAGHVQYLQLTLLLVREYQEANKGSLPDDIIAYARADERIQLQSEELYATLTAQEQEVVQQSADRCSSYDNQTKQAVPYLWNTGYINPDDCIFSPYLHQYLSKATPQPQPEVLPMAGLTTGLTKKEHLLFAVLQENRDQVTEREQIVARVWPECNEIGVSDWAVDRLVARLRSKLKKQQADCTIKTIKTRGFLLQCKNGSPMVR